MPILEGVVDLVVDLVLWLASEIPLRSGNWLAKG